jgi:Copper chaperone
MKSFRIFLTIALLMCFAQFSFAQTAQTETFKVSGNCGMCKKTIETAAKKAGATYADWNVDSKMLTVKYASVSANSAKIKQQVAESGYDTPGYKASDAAYNKLHSCCQYDRTDMAKTSCCDNKCTDETKCAEMGCCKDGKCTMSSIDQHSAKAMDCCKDGECTKEDHDAKDCCKKS